MNTSKYILLVFFVLSAIQFGYSQEKSHYKCAYRLEFLRDTLTLEYFRPETYIVQIGEGITKGFTYQKFYLDSLKTNAPDLYKQLFNASAKESIETMRKTGDVSHVRNSAFHNGSFTSDVYKDYKKNEIRVRDNVSIYSFIFTDELRPQNWEIRDDTTTILGYASQKAICHYRGRDWVAWFTSEIPISEGPWKFYGLPGLITKIQDTKKHYSFELIGFQRIEENIDTQIPKTTQKTTRKEFIKSKMGATEARITESEMARVGLSSDNRQKINQYDYIERDYK